MKKLITSANATGIALLLLIFCAFNANAAGEIKKARLQAFNRITVSGKVEITLVQDNEPEIYYEDENMGRVKVIQNGYILNISSVGKEVARLRLHVRDLWRIIATEDAVIKTEGELRGEYLQLFLKDNARLSVNSRTRGLFTMVEDGASLKLSGFTQEHFLRSAETSKLVLDQFFAVQTRNEALAVEAVSK